MTAAAKLPRRHRSAGFTMVEALVVVVVFAILATITLPAYQNAVRKSGRSAAKGALMDVALRQEQFFLNNRSYSTSLANLGLPDPYFVNKSSDVVAGADPSGVYRVTLANTSATAYDAVATPVHNQTEDLCGNYTLTSTGNRSVSGAAGQAACW